MQILSLELENVKSYAHAKIDFQRGVNAIVGWNGAGKSTILEAIGFTLFDHLGYNQRDFVREGEKSGTVTVAFISSDDLRRYEAVRRFGSSNQHYIFDPELDAKVVEGKTDVLSFLRRHMGVEPGADLARLFSDAVGVPQGAFTAAFLGTPAQRKATFDPLLQVDEYKRAFDGLREPLNALNDQRQALSVEAATLTARLENAPELDRALAAREEELAQAAQTLSQLATQVKKVEERHTELEAHKHTVQQLEQQQQALAARRAGSEQRLMEANRLLAEARAAAKTVEEHQAGYDAYVAAQQAQRALEEQNRARQRLRDERGEHEKQVALRRSELERVVAEIEAASDAEATVAQLAPALAKQARLETKRSAAQRQQAEYQSLTAQVDRHEAELSARRKRAAQLSEQLAESKRLDAKRRTLETQLAEQQQRFTTLSADLQQVKADAQRIKQQSAALASAETAVCPVCEQPLDDAHREKMLARNEEQLAEMRAAYSEKQAETSAASAGIQGTQQALNQLQETLRSLPRASDLTDLEEELTTRTAELEEMQKQLAALGDIAQKIQALEDALALLDNPREKSAIAAAQADRKAGLVDRQQRLEADLAAQQLTIDELNEKIVAFGDLDQAVAEGTAALDQHAAAYQTVLGNQQLAAASPRYSSELAVVQAEHEALTHELTQHTAELTAAQADFDPQQFAEVAQKLQALHGEQTALQTRQGMLAEDQRRDEARREQLRAVEDELARVALEQAACTRREEVLDALRRVLREAGPYITATLIRQIGDDAARIFAELMQDNTRYLTWTEEYNIVLDVSGSERQFNQLSGGEQMSAALAVRLALLREMSNIDIAFFDEPTTNLDATRRDSLAQQILNVEGLRQLFVISHDDTFEQATQNLIRVEKSGSASAVMTGQG